MYEKVNSSKSMVISNFDTFLMHKELIFPPVASKQAFSFEIASCRQRPMVMLLTPDKSASKQVD
jgi:hypothetical protein